jgi:hypothetical protein
LFKSIVSTRRKLVMGAVALTSLGLMAMSPLHHAAAESTGRITVNARACTVQFDYPLDCALVDPGPVTLFEVGGHQNLTMTLASQDGQGWVWGDNSDVPLETYLIDTSYMNVPEGFYISNVIASYGDGGGSDDGWYVAVSDNMPESVVSVIFTPYDPYTDSDNDGATDASETVFGSDPYDPASFPSAQAGPEDETDSDGDGYPDVEEVAWNTDPNDPASYPTDESGISDNVDSDGDGASDNSEVAFGSDPNDASSFPYAQAGGDDDTADSDGDGASDNSELAFGSDPNDPSSFPYAQAGGDDDAASAGPENGDFAASGNDDVANADEIAKVESLPNTGAGEIEKSAGDDMLIALGGLTVAAGAYAVRRFNV